MADQRHAVVEIGNQVFCPSAQRNDLPAGKPCGKIRRKGKPQITRAFARRG
jgi:hypothetical protein